MRQDPFTSSNLEFRGCSNTQRDRWAIEASSPCSSPSAPSVLARLLRPRSLRRPRTSFHHAVTSSTLLFIPSTSSQTRKRSRISPRSAKTTRLTFPVLDTPAPCSCSKADCPGDRPARSRRSSAAQLSQSRRSGRRRCLKKIVEREERINVGGRGRWGGTGSVPWSSPAQQA